jgi:hypothetical protein
VLLLLNQTAQLSLLLSNALGALFALLDSLLNLLDVTYDGLNLRVKLGDIGVALIVAGGLGAAGAGSGGIILERD